MAIVSGEIPDIMVVPDHQTLEQLYENDLIEDLTAAYENTASERIKEIYDSYDGRVLDTAKFDGKLMALPTTEISHGPGVLWLRKDWMDKLGLTEPKTIEDIEHIITQFVEKDPGGNGPGNTVGLVIDNEQPVGISGGQYEVNNIFALYGAFPKQWIDDGTGKAVYGSIQPEMKPALAKIADMYKKGLIDRQFAVRTSDDRKALLTSGKSGSFLDNWWEAGPWLTRSSSIRMPSGCLMSLRNRKTARSRCSRASRPAVIWWSAKGSAIPKPQLRSRAFNSIISVIRRRTKLFSRNSRITARIM